MRFHLISFGIAVAILCIHLHCIEGGGADTGGAEPGGVTTGGSNTGVIKPESADPYFEAAKSDAIEAVHNAYNNTMQCLCECSKLNGFWKQG